MAHGGAGSGWLRAAGAGACARAITLARILTAGGYLSGGIRGYDAGVARARRTRWLLLAGASLVGLVLLGALALWWSLPDVRPLRTRNPSSTAFIDLRRRQAAESGRPFRIEWTWRSLDRISPLLQRAVLHSEDAKFFRHEGVDWEAVQRTAEKDW